MECVTSRRQGASARALQGLLRLPSYQTAWVWLHELRRAMAREDPLQGAVEVGTAELWSSGEFGEEERGMIIIGAEVEGTRIGRVRMRPVRNGLSRYLHAFVEQCVVFGSTIRTDDWRGYVDLAQKGYLHEPLPYWRNWDLEEDLRGRPKYSEMPRVDWVAERLKRWLVGTHAGAVTHARHAVNPGQLGGSGTVSSHAGPHGQRPSGQRGGSPQAASLRVNAKTGEQTGSPEPAGDARSKPQTQSSARNASSLKPATQSRLLASSRSAEELE